MRVMSLRQSRFAHRAALALAVSAALPALHAAEPGNFDDLQRRGGRPATVAADWQRWDIATDGLLYRDGQRQKQVGDQLLKKIAGSYGLNAATLATAQLVDVSRSGGASVLHYRQQFEGLPVAGSGLKLIVDRDQKLVASSGWLSPFLPQATHHSLAANNARQRFAQALHQQLPARAPLQIRDSKPLFYLRQDALVPAWQFLVTDARNIDWQITLADVDGQLLARKKLTRQHSFRAWTDGVSPWRPFDGPHGNDATPYPLPARDENFKPAMIASQLISLNHSGSVSGDNWLANGVSELRGNHTDVYLDRANSNSPLSAGNRRAPTTSVDSFDHSYNFAADVFSAGNQNAAMTHAFVVANWLHDRYYNAGFTETAGNAQSDNYGRGGAAFDAMRIEVQDACMYDNANMSVPGDGNGPRMQLFLFTGEGERQLSFTGTAVNVSEPGYAGFGPLNFDINAAVVRYRDDVVASDNNPDTNDAHASIYDGCEAATNAGALAGKIAVIDRGFCLFVDKVRNAQNAGAAGVIIANHLDNSPISVMGAGSDGCLPNISTPALAMQKAEGDALKVALESGGISARLRRSTTLTDSALDSGLIAHEWGHYLTNRLMDLNSRQANGMDEGWADVVAMLMLTRPQDVTSQFAGAYGFAGFATGDYYYGFRRYPYSINAAINPLRFRHISNNVALPATPVAGFGSDGSNNSEVHNTGEVWAAMIWDAWVGMLTSERFTFQQAEARMLEYIVAGMKAMPADPDFVQARDAMLTVVGAASSEDREIFMAAFANRGLGIGAVAPVKSDDAQLGAIESYARRATQAPIASAGNTQNVTPGSSVTLDGSASRDPDGNIVSWQWRQTVGASVTLSDAGSARASFTAPQTTGALTFELQVIDDAGARNSASVSVNVAPANQPPTVSINSSVPSVVAGQTVGLAATASDADGQIASVQWTQLAGPSVTISNSGTLNASFVAPNVSTATSLQFRIIVTDNAGATAQASTSVLVNPAASNNNGGGGGGGGSLTLATGILLAWAASRRRRAD